jgi:hypothetical protein
MNCSFQEFSCLPVNFENLLLASKAGQLFSINKLIKLPGHRELSTRGQKGAKIHESLFRRSGKIIAFFIIYSYRMLIYRTFRAATQAIFIGIRPRPPWECGRPRPQDCTDAEMGAFKESASRYARFYIREGEKLCFLRQFK